MIDSSEVPVVQLKPKRALPFFKRHPWVFAGAIRTVAGNPAPGDEVIVRASDGRFVAWGLFNPQSNIRVRLYSWNEDQTLSRDLFQNLIREAVAMRSTRLPLEAGRQTAQRIIFSEADGLSGLTVDSYALADDLSGRWLVVSLTSLALAARSDRLLDVLEEQTGCQGIWLRTEKGILDSEGLEQRDGLVRGSSPPRPLPICENGLSFEIDLAEGQKTGWFLDQAANRSAVARYLRGDRVLDLFCYTGGFAITVAKQTGARQVTGVDSSAPAIEQARRNAELNDVHDQVRFEQSDVFRFLEQARDRGDRFDMVIVDPPKMVRRQSGVARALRGYHSLNELAASLVRPGGCLVSCSCSGLISREDFERMLGGVATSLGRQIQILESRGAAPDHPVSPTCPENAYLQCCICHVGHEAWPE